jgi:hypothetical protein
MAKSDDIIKEIHELLDKRVEEFTGSMPAVQKKMYAEVLAIAKDLDTYSDGTIKPTLKNVKAIAKIKQKLNEVILDGKYYKELNKVIDTYEKITTLQNAYFTSIVGQFGVPAVLAEIQKTSIDITVERLGKDGMNAGVINKVRDILNKNITTGGKITDFIEEARIYLTDTPEGDGALKKYSTTIVTDALNQYSRQYNQLVSDDLGFKFFQYVGSLRETSREFCIKMIEAKEGCMVYFHVSQIPELLSGRICGEQIHINKKSGLPDGLIKGTNASNFFVNAGGYTCNHGVFGVSTFLVPKELREKFNEK